MTAPRNIRALTTFRIYSAPLLLPPSSPPLIPTLQDILPRPPVPGHGGNGTQPPEKWGITVLQFLEFVGACKATAEWARLFAEGMTWCAEGKAAPACVTGYEVCNKFVIPWTAGTGCGVSLLMNKTPQQAQVMISHGE